MVWLLIVGYNKTNILLKLNRDPIPK